MSGPNLSELDSMRTEDLQLVCDDATETREVIRSVRHRRAVAYINVGAEILAHRMVRRSNQFDELLLACQLQHQAIDLLFAKLVRLTRDHTPDDPFLPSTSGAPWNAVTIGNAAIAKARGQS